MRQPLPVDYYESRLQQEYNKAYIIEPLEEWHGLRTNVRIFCHIHQQYRNVFLMKVFNGKKRTHPCRICCFSSEEADTEL